MECDYCKKPINGNEDFCVQHFKTIDCRTYKRYYHIVNGKNKLDDCYSRNQLDIHKGNVVQLAVPERYNGLYAYREVKEEEGDKKLDLITDVCRFLDKYL